MFEKRRMEKLAKKYCEDLLLYKEVEKGKVSFEDAVVLVGCGLYFNLIGAYVGYLDYVASVKDVVIAIAEEENQRKRDDIKGVKAEIRKMNAECDKKHIASTKEDVEMDRQWYIYRMLEVAAYLGDLKKICEVAGKEVDGKEAVEQYKASPLFKSKMYKAVTKVEIVGPELKWENLDPEDVLDKAIKKIIKETLPLIDEALKFVDCESDKSGDRLYEELLASKMAAKWTENLPTVEEIKEEFYDEAKVIANAKLKRIHEETAAAMRKCGRGDEVKEFIDIL